MKKIFTLTILIYSCCITHIYAQEKESEISVAKQNQDKCFFRFPTQMPQFQGGDAELMKFINENLKCPKSMSDNCIQGQVIVRFVVSKDGSVKDVQVLRSLESACDKEAIRVVESMPKWTPGKENGKPVDVYYTLPVRFKLEADIKQEE